MSKFIKNHIITELEDQLRDRGEMLVIDMSGMTGVDANNFRVEMGQKDISLLTVKNSLARRACDNVGLESLSPVLEGPSTIVWGGEDIVALSREITRWAKEIDELDVKGGSVEGQTLDAAGVDTLSKSPGRPELLSQIAGLILSPGGNIAGQIESKAEDDDE